MMKTSLATAGNEMTRAGNMFDRKRIFVTVGTQCPYPRLVDAVAVWAAVHPEVRVFAQTAEVDGRWCGIEHVAFLEPEEYRRHFKQADLVIAHAGMGTIVGALEVGKPVVVLPRKASLGEHRNEHQAATAHRFGGCPAVRIVDDADSLGTAMDAMLGACAPQRIDVPPPAALAQRIRYELEFGAGKPLRGRRRLFAIASGGGHWVQLCRLLSALESTELICATTPLGDRSLAPCSDVRRIHDGNRWNKTGLMRSAIDVFRLVAALRPDAVLTTGAAPGYFALRAARWFGARTIWLDSLANANKLSLSGQKAGNVADVWLTQWPELATPGGPEYAGSVLPMFDEVPVLLPA